MAWYTAVFLGLVQGFTEFLPVSSSGHLMLFEYLCGVETGGLLFTIVLHLATLLAVVLVYWRRLWGMLRHPLQAENWRLLTATGITCVLVLIGKSCFDRYANVWLLPWTFMLTAVVLWLPQWFTKRPRAGKWTAAVSMGLAQGVAVLPGLSRSGLTISAGQLAGLGQTEAADFSFIMSVPIIMASLIYELARGGTMGQVGLSNLGLAFGCALVGGVVAIKVMLKVARQVDFRGFAFYLLLLGAGFGLYLWL